MICLIAPISPATKTGGIGDNRAAPERTSLHGVAEFQLHFQHSQAWRQMFSKLVVPIFVQELFKRTFTAKRNQTFCRHPVEPQPSLWLHGMFSPQPVIVTAWNVLLE